MVQQLAIINLEDLCHPVYVVDHTKPWWAQKILKPQSDETIWELEDRGTSLIYLSNETEMRRSGMTTFLKRNGLFGDGSREEQMRLRLRPVTEKDVTALDWCAGAVSTAIAEMKDHLDREARNGRGPGPDLPVYFVDRNATTRALVKATCPLVECLASLEALIQSILPPSDAQGPGFNGLYLRG